MSFSPCHPSGLELAGLHLELASKKFRQQEPSSTSTSNSARAESKHPDNATSTVSSLTTAVVGVPWSAGCHFCLHFTTSPTQHQQLRTNACSNEIWTAPRMPQHQNNGQSSKLSENPSWEVRLRLSGSRGSRQRGQATRNSKTSYPPTANIRLASLPVQDTRPKAIRSTHHAKFIRGHSERIPSKMATRLASFSTTANPPSGKEHTPDGSQMKWLCSNPPSDRMAKPLL